MIMISKHLLKINEKAFSLLELIIYITLLSGIMLVIVNMFFMISASSAKEEARAEVQQNLRFAIDRLAGEIRSAREINFPLGGSSDSVLELNGSTIKFTVSGGILQRIEGVNVENITTNKVAVNTASPIFTRIDNIGAKPSIQIILTISYNDNGRGDYKFSKTIQTSVSLRQ